MQTSLGTAVPQMLLFAWFVPVAGTASALPSCCGREPPPQAASELIVPFAAASIPTIALVGV